MSPRLDESRRRRFERDGYTVVPLLDRAEAAALADELGALLGDRPLDPAAGAAPEREHYHTSFTSPDEAYRRAAAALILARCAAPAAAILPGHVPVLAGSVVKAPSSKGAALHMDLSFSPDLAAAAINIWCPLVDVDDSNGTLRLVPGSHRLFPHIASMETTSGYWAPYASELMERSVPVDLQAGEAVLYDSTLLHGSRPNATGRVRPVAQLNFLPQGVSPVVYSLDPSSGGGRFEMFDMSGNALLAHGALAFHRRDFRAPSLGYVDNPGRPVTLPEFERRRKAAARRRGRPATGLTRFLAAIRGRLA